MIDFLRSLFGIGTGDIPSDGFGQSLADDVRFALRFRKCRRRDVVWRVPTWDEGRAFDIDPIIGRFGDITIAVAEVDGRRWLVRERDWHGWPDPPRYVFFALDGSGIWAGADFDGWPKPWRLAD
jgi:hypothetical protein